MLVAPLARTRREVNDMPERIPAEVEEQVLSMRADGITNKVIMARLGIGTGALYGTFRRHDVQWESGYGPTPADVEADVLAMRAEGVPAVKIMARTGIGKEALYGILRRHDGQKRRWRRLTDEEADQVVAEYTESDDLTIGHVAEMHDITSKQVFRLLHSRAVDLTRRPVPECGTKAGFRAHKRKGERVCGNCYRAQHRTSLRKKSRIRGRRKTLERQAARAERMAQEGPSPELRHALTEALQRRE